jgi:hypothetical protein
MGDDFVLRSYLIKSGKLTKKLFCVSIIHFGSFFLCLKSPQIVTLLLKLDLSLEEPVLAPDDPLELTSGGIPVFSGA